MKIKKVLLRWYKSFHLNYRGITEKGEVTAYRPWNKSSPVFAPSEEFPFIEIPIEDDITSIVGANESGKSHLLNAISKAIRGVGIEQDDEFRQTDLCHYAGVRTRNVEAWPHLGLQFRLTDAEEINKLKKAIKLEASGSTETASSFTLLLAHDPKNPKPARVFIEPN